VEPLKIDLTQFEGPESEQPDYGLRGLCSAPVVSSLAAECYPPDILCPSTATAVVARTDHGNTKNRRQQQ
jgi:hypothetical protein